MKSPLRGKKLLKDRVAVTLTDFGQWGRRVEVATHYSFAAAFRSYRNHWDIYTRLHGGRLWIEPVVDGRPSGGEVEGWRKEKDRL